MGGEYGAIYRRVTAFIAAMPLIAALPLAVQLLQRGLIAADLVLMSQAEAFRISMAVLNTLKPWLDEKLYERALVIELRKRGHNVDQQMQFPIHYDGQLIGTLVLALIVDELVIADPKGVTAFKDTHLAQMIGYLNITDLRRAVLLNFIHSKLDWKRVVR